MLSSKTDRGSDATAETGSSPARGTATGPVAALFDAVAIEARSSRSVMIWKSSSAPRESRLT